MRCAGVEALLANVLQHAIKLQAQKDGTRLDSAFKVAALLEHEVS